MNCHHILLTIKLIFLIFFYQSTTTFSSNYIINPSNSSNTIQTAVPLQSLDRPEIRILVYDKIKGYLNWFQDWFKQYAYNNCNTKCILTEYSSEQYSLVDMVLFHAPTHNLRNQRFPPHKPNIIFTLVSMEQPNYAVLLKNKNDLQQHFNLLATYSLQPTYPGTNINNLPLTYYPLNILSVEAVMQDPRPFSKKTGYGTGVMVALFASNCHAAGATQRYTYIEELMKHIKVHSYGKCFNNREEPKLPDDPGWPIIAQKRARKIKVLSRYKFYLAFENLAVTDYVSEKVFEGLFAGAISVYRGTDTIHHFMPSNSSFINANNLTPKQLADLMTKIGSNEDEYNKYFAFKKQPLAKSFIEMANMSYCHPNVLCRLCDYALLERNKIST